MDTPDIDTSNRADVRIALRAIDARKSADDRVLIHYLTAGLWTEHKRREWLVRREWPWA